ncbi:MAG: peptidoglycan editing factor PgeF [Candidatus Omnitrophota bacterium]
MSIKAINQSCITKIKNYYCFAKLQAEDIVAVFSDRSLDLGFKNNPCLIENRKIFLENLSIGYYSLVCLKQPHEARIKRARFCDLGRGALDYTDALNDYDAFITNEKDLPLAIFTADCLPIFVFDPLNKAIGLAHAGWRGSRAGIAKNTISAMITEFNSHPQDLIVAFGPCICRNCYLVSNEFKNYFSDGLTEKDGKLYLDLIKINRSQLEAAAVNKENIIESGLCTSCNNQEFFSYRKEGPSCGRMMSVIMLK